MGDHEIVFGPFRLDCDNRQLWRGEQLLAVQPKPLAVLQYLNQTTEDSYTYTLSVRSSSGHPERTATQAQAKTPHCVCP